MKPHDRHSAAQIAAKMGVSSAAVRLWRRTKTRPKNAILAKLYKDLCK